MKTSAYMIAHCDDDYLQQAIDSVIDRVDELIFVDGAYAWVAPFFEKSGIDPTRSWQSTHDILAKYGKKIKYFSGIWDDELHKRSFGYAQCRGDIIIRIDADEIFVFDDREYAAFLASDKGVAEMEFPYQVTPGSQRLKAELDHTPKQCAVFKARHYKTPLAHCAHLWLVLTEAERARCGEADWSRLYAQPVIRTAHLTGFRTPRTSVNRARFYTLQYIRTTGKLQWPYNQTPVENPDDKIAQIFDLLTPEEYASYLEGHDIVSGYANMDGFIISPYAFAGKAGDQVQAAFDAHNASLEALLDFEAHPRLVVSNIITLINVTALIRRGVTRFEIEYEDEMDQATGHLSFLLDTAENQTGINLEAVHSKTVGKVASYSFQPVDDSAVIQACLVLRPKAKGVNKTRIVRLTVLD
jgi:hypothetical protein